MNNWSCLGRVAAEIAGESLADFISFCGHDGSEKIDDPEHPEGRRAFSWEETARYLAERGYSLGMGIQFGNAGRLGITPDVAIQTTIDLREIEAIILVDSPAWKKALHALFWKNGRLIDPDPAIGDITEQMGHIPIRWIWPIVLLRDNKVMRRGGRATQDCKATGWR